MVCSWKQYSSRAVIRQSTSGELGAWLRHGSELLVDVEDGVVLKCAHQVRPIAVVAPHSIHLRRTQLFQALNPLSTVFISGFDAGRRV